MLSFRIETFAGRELLTWELPRIVVRNFGVTDQLESCLIHGINNVILNFAQVRDIDTKSITSLTTLMVKFLKMGGNLKLVAMSKHILEKFQSLGMRDMLQLYETEEQALTWIDIAYSITHRTPGIFIIGSLLSKRVNFLRIIRKNLNYLKPVLGKFIRDIIAGEDKYWLRFTYQMRDDLLQLIWALEQDERTFADDLVSVINSMNCWQKAGLNTILLKQLVEEVVLEHRQIFSSSLPKSISTSRQYIIYRIDEICSYIVTHIFPELLKLLSQSNSQIMLQIGQKLDKLTRQIIPLLLQHFGHHNPDISSISQSLMQKIRLNKQYLPALVQVFVSGNMQQRKLVASLLVKLGKQATPELIRLLGHSSATIREATIQCLVDIGETVIPQLQQAFTDGLRSKATSKKRYASISPQHRLIKKGILEICCRINAGDVLRHKMFSIDILDSKNKTTSLCASRLAIKLTDTSN